MASKGLYGCVNPIIDCDLFDLPKAHVSNCPANYGALESEICDIWLTVYKDGYQVPAGDPTPAPATDWLDPANYSNATVDEIVHLVVIGDKPLPEFNDITVAKRWVIPSFTRHSLNFDVSDFAFQPGDDAVTEDQCKMLNYEFIRALQQRPTLVLWFRTISGIMFGGPAGIVCDVTSAGTILGRGEGTLMTGSVVLTWESACDPPAQPELSLCEPGVAAMAMAMNAPQPLI